MDMEKIDSGTCLPCSPCHQSDLTTELGFSCTHAFSNGAVEYKPPRIHIYSRDKRQMMSKQLSPNDGTNPATLRQTGALGPGVASKPLLPLISKPVLPLI